MKGRKELGMGRNDKSAMGCAGGGGGAAEVKGRCRFAKELVVMQSLALVTALAIASSISAPSQQLLLLPTCTFCAGSRSAGSPRRTRRLRRHAG